MLNEDHYWFDDWCGVIGFGIGALLLLIAGLVPVPDTYQGDVRWLMSASIPLVVYVLGLVTFVIILCIGMVLILIPISTVESVSRSTHCDL